MCSGASELSDDVCLSTGLDGSTSASERERLINQFNDPENNATWVFLLSTRFASLLSMFLSFSTHWQKFYHSFAAFLSERAAWG